MVLLYVVMVLVAPMVNIAKKVMYVSSSVVGNSGSDHLCTIMVLGFHRY